MMIVRTQEISQALLATKLKIHLPSPKALKNIQAMLVVVVVVAVAVVVVV
jgi:hypothetical protein